MTVPTRVIMVKKTPTVSSRALVEEHDAQQHEQVGVAVDHRVEEGPEGALAPGEPRERAVEEIEEAGHGEQHRPQPQAPLGERVGGGDAHAEPEHGELVRPHPRAQEQPRDGIGDAVQRAL